MTNIPTEYDNFIIFSFEGYYPNGGLGDVRGSYTTLEEAIAACKEKDIVFGPLYLNDFCYIVDRNTWQIVWDKDKEQQEDNNND